MQTSTRSALIGFCAGVPGLLFLTGIQSCEEPGVDGDGDGWTLEGGDCDDADPAVHPEAAERCNGLDDDCDLEADDGTGLTAVAAGAYHTLALCSDASGAPGNVWAWGANWNGQLGDGTTTERATPAVVGGLSDVVAISAGYAHSLALRADGTVWAWGRNGSGQLGDGTLVDRAVPVQVAELEGVARIVAGGSHNLALLGDGRVFAWGENEEGQLGAETTTPSAPIQVPGLGRVVAIAAGGFHSLAVVAETGSSGTVMAWGSNFYGQLGDGTYYSHTTPAAVEGLSNITAVAAGGYHSLALRSDGVVRAWGRGTEGQLGNANTLNRTYSVQVQGLTGATAISAGGEHSLALKGSGASSEVWSWGYNNQGQLGDGTTTNRTSAAKVASLSGARLVSAGDIHSLALGAGEGTLGAGWSWGSNGRGQLGDGTHTGRLTPGPIAAIP